MATATWPLQVAMITALRAHADLTSRVSGVYDEVPEPAPYPYVSLGSMVETVDDAHDRQGLEITVTWHVWSHYPGTREAAEIFAALDAALDRVPLAVAGFTDISVSHIQHETIKDPDPDIRHINAQYRVWLTKL